MNLFREILRRLWTLIHRNQFDSELQEEMRLHNELREQEEIERGLSPEEAHYAVQRRFGNDLVLREESRDMWGWNWLENSLQDVRYGVRVLMKNPGFTAVAVLTLALGIGANTAIFSVVYAVLLRPLPYKEPGRLVMVWTTEEHRSGYFPASGPDYVDWKGQNHVFEDLAAGTGTGSNLTGAGEPLHVEGWEASTNIFAVLGVQPLLGKGFLPGDDQEGRDHVVVLGYGLWQRGFGGEPAVVGRNITLDGQTYSVAGVLPAWFRFPNIWGRNAEFWKPLSLAKPTWRHNRRSHFLWTVGRLRPATDISAARAEMETIAARLAKRYPNSNQGVDVNLVGLHNYVVRGVRTQLLILLAAVGFILLIACANTANLLLAQGSRRWREIAVRFAVGAGRGRIMSQLLVESALLSLLGSAVGMVLAVGLKNLLLRATPAGYFPGITPIVVDSRVLAFNSVIALLTALVFGMAPAWAASRVDPNEALKESAPSAGISHARVRGPLIVGEVAVSLILLVGAGLAIRSLVRLLGVQLGFDPHNVLTAEVVLPKSRYPDSQHTTSFFLAVREKLSSLPGVISVGATNELPTEGGSNGPVAIEGQPLPSFLFKGPMVETCIATANYFRTMGIPLLRGRDFNERDGFGQHAVAIINQAMAQRFWPNQDPIGKRFSWETEHPKWIEVVGVVGDARVFSIASPPFPEAYSPLGAQAPSNEMVVAVRSASDPSAYSASAVKAIHDLDPDLPVSHVRTMEQIVQRGAAGQRLSASLFGLFAALGLVMAAVGVYGVISSAVSQRTHEIGIRMALGACRDDVLRWILFQGMRLSLLGIGIGLIAAWALTRLMKNLLYEVDPCDPMTLILVSSLLVAVALLASYIPARRATKVDPMVALRYE